MKYLKMLGLAAFAAMAFTAFVGASSASATTLSITGVPQTGSVTIYASLTTGKSAVLRDTFGFSANTCTGSHAHGSTESPFTAVGTGKIGGALTPANTTGESGLTFSGCTNPVTPHQSGKLLVEWNVGTTNGTVYSSGAQVTVWSSLHGTYINCETGGGTLIGTLTGVKHGHAELDINATLTCGPHLHSAKWTGEYIVTTPTDLGVEE